MRADMRVTDRPQSLYQTTVAIRPKLIELIQKYSQKKGEYWQAKGRTTFNLIYPAR